MATEENVIVIPADEAEPIRAESIEMRLEDLQSIVGGYIEQVEGSSTWSALVNSEGAIVLLPMNERASKLMRQPIAGEVVLVGTKGSEMISVPAEVAEAALAL